MRESRNSPDRADSLFKTPLLRNSLVLLGTSVLGYGLGFLFWLLVARIHPADTVGLAATLLTTTFFLAGISTLGLQLGLIRFLPEESDKVGFINRSTMIAGASAIGLGAVFVAGLDLWAKEMRPLREDPLLAAGFFLSLFAFTASAILDASFVAVREPQYGLVRNSIYNLTRLPLPLVLSSLGVAGVLFSWTAAILVSLAIDFTVLLPRVFPGYRITQVGKKSPTEVIKYSLWNQGAVTVASAAASLLPLVILNGPGNRGGAAASAHFYAAYTIASLLYVVPGSFSLSLFVEGSYPEARFARDVRRAAGVSILLLAIGIGGAVLFGNAILGLFGEAYAGDGFGTLVVLSLASPMVLANSIFSTSLRVAKRVRQLLGIVSVSSLVTLVSAYLLLPSMGILGAGFALALGQGLAVPLFYAEHRTLSGHDSTTKK